MCVIVLLACLQCLDGHVLSLFLFANCLGLKGRNARADAFIWRQRRNSGYRRKEKAYLPATTNGNSSICCRLLLPLTFYSLLAQFRYTHIFACQYSLHGLFFISFMLLIFFFADNLADATIEPGGRPTD